MNSNSAMVAFISTGLFELVVVVVERSVPLVHDGVQPTGIPHVKVQKTTELADTLLFSIVGWLALTLPQDPATLRSARDDVLATLLAIGLDPKQSIVLNQDHSRLAISSDAGSEDEVDESLLNSGLFTYLVLRAADVLVKRPEPSTPYRRPADARDSRVTHVPVGEDQQQHTELT
ncbi:hypothetical protein EDD17DRAFT_1517309 [Pisolithus thermaeus]|nr:hypothetical protein EDD17DRAFT_1517309 [Pisolithus thermaeus]